MRGQRSSFEYAAALSISTWRMIQYKSMSPRRLTQASHKVRMAYQQQYCQLAVVYTAVPRDLDQEASDSYATS